MEERHRRIARLALAAAGKFSLALAGGYAIQGRGIGSRPSGDVDLFVNWSCRDDFDDAVSAVAGALETAGMGVEVVARGETVARLLVTDPQGVASRIWSRSRRTGARMSPSCLI